MSSSYHATQLATSAEVPRGRHLLIDCRNVSREVCLNDKLVLQAMAQGAEEAGANVISQVRYKFGADSPPGFTAAIILDESHCTAHSYADLGLIAMDVFTCGTTDPHNVLAHIQSQVDLGEVTVTELPRFAGAPDAFPKADVQNDPPDANGDIAAICV